jgi:hypothetical protein
MLVFVPEQLAGVTRNVTAGILESFDVDPEPLQRFQRPFIRMFLPH